jgi:hypothetical protein
MVTFRTASQARYDMLIETKLGIVFNVVLLSLPGRAVVDPILEDLTRLEG